MPAKVQLNGVRGELRDNVMAHLSLDNAPCEAPSWRLRRLMRKADAEVREALEAFGYYNSVIGIERAAAEGGCWLVVIDIDAGAAVQLRSVDVSIEGDAVFDPAFQRLQRRPPLRSGAQLDHALYERYKKAFGDLARQRGYFGSSFIESRIDIHAGQDLADVTLHWDSGPRYRFGPVTFDQEVVRSDLVERFVDFEPGDPYDGSRVAGLYDALLGTGYFASVELRSEPTPPPDNEVPVAVAMTPAKRHVYTLGGGYSTDKGPKLRAGYTDRRVNDAGHQLEAQTEISEVDSTLGVSYRLPRRDPRVEWLHLDAGYRHENTKAKRADTYKLGIKEFRRRPAGWIETRFIDLSIEDFTIAGDHQRELLLIPGLSWTHTFPGSLSVTRPDSGHRLSLTVSGTSEWLGSDSEFLQAEVYAKFITPLWRGGRLLLRGEAGGTVKDQLRSLPASVRYFAGGDNSVRGYDYQSLGPTDSRGKVVGGSYKLIGSMEVDQRVRGNWSLAAFVDVGNAFDKPSAVTMKTGVGAGIRWYSPLGPIRLDVGVPLDSDAPDSWRLHITLGPDL